MPDIKTVADRADIIVNGYAFTQEDERIHVLNLNCPDKAKFFVKNNGDSVLQNRGILSDREIAKISEFIKDHYQEMYLRWSQYSNKGFFGK